MWFNEIVALYFRLAEWIALNVVCVCECGVWREKILQLFEWRSCWFKRSPSPFPKKVCAFLWNFVLHFDTQSSCIVRIIRDMILHQWSCSEIYGPTLFIATIFDAITKYIYFAQLLLRKMWKTFVHMLSIHLHRRAQRCLLPTARNLWQPIWMLLHFAYMTVSIGHIDTWLCTAQNIKLENV